MFQLLINNTSSKLQNVYTPLPFRMHFVFCLLATLLYLVQFYRKRSAYYLLIMAAIDLTFITQYWTSKPVIWGLGIAEVILLVLAALSAYRYNKKIKAQNAQANAQLEKALTEKKEAEKTFAEENEKIVDNAFDDEKDL